MTRFLALSLTIVLSACGGTGKPAASPEAEGPEQRGPEGHDDHAGMPASLHDFHELLAPLWHMAAGDERTAKTCDSLATFKERATAVKSVPVPPGAKVDEEGWNRDATALAASVEELSGACAAEGRREFQSKFQAVHEAFHRLLQRTEER